jgi:hypothetical protein
MKNIRENPVIPRQYRYLAFLTGLSFFFTGCFSGNPQDSSTTAQMEQTLKTKLADVLPKIDSELQATATYLDLENGYEYSNETGLQKIDTGHEDKKGVIRFANGAFLKKHSQTVKESNSIQSRANFIYLRSVKSIIGYNGASAEITPPNTNVSLWFSGINEAGEAGYNYFGIKSTQTICVIDAYNPICPPGTIPQTQAFDVEGGLFTSAGPYYIQGRYLFYISNNGNYSILR